MAIKLVQAPAGSPNFCFGLYDAETGEELCFIQSDWGYAIASRFG